MNTQTAPSTGNLTYKGVQRTLSNSIIAPLGPTRLTKNGRGNLFVREGGTRVMIFNVLAFRNMEEANAAKVAWLAGKKLELAGDKPGAQDHYKKALNHLMSFSVLEQNAADYQSVYEISAIAEIVKNTEGKEVLALNQPRPIAVGITGSSAASIFADDAPVLTAAEKKAAEKKAAKEKLKAA